MGKAYFRISSVLFRDLIGLPDTTTIGAVEQTAIEALRGYFRVYIESPDFPELAEGDDIPEHTPTFRAVEPAIAEFKRWT